MVGTLPHRSASLRLVVLAPLLCLAATSAFAAGKIFYGSRIGMQVTVVGVSAIGSAHAEVRVRHTPEDAKAFCVEYSNDRSAGCVERELRETRLNDAVRGNCITGRFTSLYGEDLRFVGETKHRKDTDPKYRILDSGGKPLDGTSASGYSYDLEQFEAICPARASGGD